MKNFFMGSLVIVLTMVGIALGHILVLFAPIAAIVALIYNAVGTGDSKK